MKMITLKIHKWIVDSQLYGSDNEHMVSRVFFEAEGVEYVCDIRQAYGSNNSIEEDPIEVVAPDGLKNTFNYETFRSAIEDYYRTLIGQQGKVFRIENSTNIRMQNITMNVEHIVEVERDGLSGGW